MACVFPGSLRWAGNTSTGSAPRPCRARDQRRRRTSHKRRLERETRPASGPRLWNLHELGAPSNQSTLTSSRSAISAPVDVQCLEPAKWRSTAAAHRRSWFIFGRGDLEMIVQRESDCIAHTCSSSAAGKSARPNYFELSISLLISRLGLNLSQNGETCLSSAWSPQYNFPRFFLLLT